MPTYYVPSQPSHHHRQRTYSHGPTYYPTQPAQNPQVVYASSQYPQQYSPGHHTVAYAQPTAHYTTRHTTPATYHYDSGRHRASGHGRSHSGGGGHTHHPSSAPLYVSTSRHSAPHHHTATHRSTTTTRRSRSQSVPRATSRAVPVRTVDYGYNSGHRLHRPESGRSRETTTHNYSNRHRDSSRSPHSHEPLSERIRRMFGLGGHSSHRDHSADSMDRGGRTVDWRGRPIYRV
ncbi:hypothetical protein C8Q74DRAFT_1217890 [Fomes fomentarius]|nr:hypothetical protein C8Q74DRAFT_1217890 [Fomes fomentarius]